MSITIEDPDFETLLAEVAASAGRNGTDLLVDLLRRERERLDEERAHRIAEGLKADDDLRAQWSALSVVDERIPVDVLSYDENGLPA
ncbi:MULTISPECIES: type II toxin-antitoxin system VapB family antitoxin [unclassified Methylobacterium]|uniref:type II toxin-antitoxin system VapB family antitoxin n=1 Tax=unclassified Methylobacterium TaxID=2615210 RepID=UPI00070065B1|nr:MULTISPECIES: type II toxin-antitoxin system VapB family antitoxin [unclassified Methylobacterium]KQP58809.1 hypothetical protein ASF39_17570 [Methylobacterium sp. Leaf108]KQT88632.1 hypothetical protein ASG59_15580 [Methylobacterium sp. Leaf466]